MRFDERRKGSTNVFDSIAMHICADDVIARIVLHFTCDNGYAGNMTVHYA